MHELGVDAYRMSIAWPRLIPGNTLDRVSTERLNKKYVSVFHYSIVGSALLIFYITFLLHLDGRGAVNPKGLEYYNNLIDELLSYGI